jgi:AcrR family transcriptional regulator
MVVAPRSTDDRLLDATGTVLARVGWSQVTMAAVATDAGVSRQTLYKRFGSRAELAQAYVLREAGRLVALVDAAIAEHGDDPRAAIAAAFETFLAAAAEHPLVRAIVGEGDRAAGDDELLELVTIRGRSVLDAAAHHLAAVLRDTWPALSPASADLAAEIAVRLAISTAALPGGPAALDGGRLGEALAPYLEQELSGDSPGLRDRS